MLIVALRHSNVKLTKQNSVLELTLEKHTSRHIILDVHVCTRHGLKYMYFRMYLSTSTSTLFFEVLQSKHKYPHEVLKYMTPLVQ